MLVPDVRGRRQIAECMHHDFFSGVCASRNQSHPLDQIYESRQHSHPFDQKPTEASPEHAMGQGVPARTSHRIPPLNLQAAAKAREEVASTASARALIKEMRGHVTETQNAMTTALNSDCRRTPGCVQHAANTSAAGIPRSNSTASVHVQVAAGAANTSAVGIPRSNSTASVVSFNS